MKSGCKALILLACVSLTTACGVVYRGSMSLFDQIATSSLVVDGRRGELSEEELSWARVAWSYFENNFNDKTGLVNSIDRYPSVNMWTVGDQLMATLSAHRLGLINEEQFDRRFSLLLDWLNSMALLDGRVPNSAYDSRTGVMVNYENKPGGVGWSSIDLGRLLMALHLSAQAYPRFREYVEKAVLRWDFCLLVGPCGGLKGGSWVNGNLDAGSEARSGFAQYAAAAYEIWGFDTPIQPQISASQVVMVNGYALPMNLHPGRSDGSYQPLASLPFLLYGMELGLAYSEQKNTGNDSRNDAQGPRQQRPAPPSPKHVQSNKVLSLAQYSERIYKAQKARFETSGVLTARTDHPVHKPPYFVFDSIYGAGFAFNTLSDRGEYMPELALVSTRAVFGMWALWRDGYTDQLVDAIKFIKDPQRGFFEGRYEESGGWEKTISLTTNAMVLQALAYKQNGRFERAGGPSRHLKSILSSPFTRPQHCWPQDLQCPAD